MRVEVHYPPERRLAAQAVAPSMITLFITWYNYKSLLFISYSACFSLTEYCLLTSLVFVKFTVQGRKYMVDESFLNLLTGGKSRL